MSMYTNTWFKITLELLEDQIKDLRSWSVHNDDKYLNEIHELEAVFEILKGRIK